MANKQVANIEAASPTAEEIASSIVRLSEAADKLLASGLTMRALTLLLQDATGVTKSDINKVLLALPELRKTYVKASKK